MYAPSIFNNNFVDSFFNDPFDSVFDDMFRSGFGNVGTTAMSTDVQDLGDSYQMEMELPGYEKQDLKADLKDGYLTISAEKSLEKDKENKQGKMLRQERYSGVMQRSFYVGEHLTEEDVKASYESGVLHIKFPKKEALKAPEKKTILIEG